MLLGTRELTEQIREVGLRQGADLVGFVSAQQLEQGAPEGHRPSNLFPEAKSVIVLACGRELNEDREYFYQWGAHFSLTLITLKEELLWRRRQSVKSVDAVKEFVKSQGLDAVVEYCGWSGILSFKMAAYLAGLGVFGKGSFLVHPGRGPLNVLGCVLTNALLEYGKPLTVDVCGECLECLRACKYGALTAKGFNGARCRAYDLIMNPVTEKWTYGPCNSKCVNQCPIGR